MISPTLQNRRQHAAIPKDKEHEFMKAEMCVNLQTTARTTP